ncbi:endogenous retrovirus group k member 25 pol [Limosa lapponica baueri]|uniref:Endogenous retrovirus group k member 25 pol n=1 Tax=Limosa lapponica baueri TaxID=1758121 RepID=A0A2I0UTU1_LIMLA|nr:endogenous retrovirus group k member 25 pol [Limosa lapponica baueri]
MASSYIFATAHTGEESRDIRRHWLAAIAAMGIPETIKTDNGPKQEIMSKARSKSKNIEKVEKDQLEL